MRRVFDTITSGVAMAALLVLLLDISEFGSGTPHFYRIVNFVVLLVFCTDISYRIWSSTDRRAHLRKNWLDFIVLLPLLQYAAGVPEGPWSVMARQAVILVMLFTRTRRVKSLSASLALKPAQLMALTFLGAIYVGTVLLMLPSATVSGQQTGLVDALFTATSATCVTGLIVVDTATHFSRFGQLVILALIQLGGLGIMTFAVSLGLLAGKEGNLKQRATLQNIMDQDALAHIYNLIVFIVAMTAVFELAGFGILALAWQSQIPDAGARLYHAFFHAVSAFCNAGFSTFDDSLSRFDAHAATNLTICFLIIVGGLGFTVIRDLAGNLQVKLTGSRRPHYKFRVQTKVVLFASAMLIGLGAVVFFALERQASLHGLPGVQALWISFFHSVSARTAGFNTWDVGALSSATLAVMMILMFIGASPGSTGGGIKTSTAAVLFEAVLANLRHREHAEAFRRTLPWETVQKAITVLVLSLCTVAVFAVLLLYTEQRPLGEVLFETVSAFGTVGLSTGLTAELTVPGRILVTMLMFIGRLGPLTMVYSLLRSRPAAAYTYAEEKVMIG